MKIFKLKNGADTSKIISSCCAALRNSRTVLLLPTETVYGLMCRWNDSEAIQRIKSMKCRDENKPFQILAHNIKAIEKIGAELSGKATIIAESFCPGPITIIVKNKNGSTIGFRSPAHKFMLELLAAFGEPLAATSANLSGKEPAANFAEALESLREKPDIAVDDGELASKGMASTVVDVSGDEIKIIRPGPISEEDIIKAISRQNY